jgi:glutamate--cysteine ligase
MPPSSAFPESPPVRSVDELLEAFHAAEKPPARFRIGAEAEKIGVFSSGAALPYAGERSVERIFEALTHYGWQREAETADGPTIALTRGSASITLEPGSQLELSGAAHPDLHLVAEELAQHLAELAPISQQLDVIWLGVGFHPLARQAELTWVPKQRYAIMREYLPPLGHAAHDMMRRTATVQANYDYENESDAMQKLVLSLKLSPLIHAMLANSPFYEGVLSDKKSLRGEVWLNMDPARSGLIPTLWDKPAPRYLDYAEWALDAGMFLFKRGSEVIANTGQTFRAFLSDGFKGHRATVSDFKLHLQTLFPEARLKNTLEVRACDTLPAALSMVVPALFTGILYDRQAFEQARELAAPWSYDAMQGARPALIRQGLGAILAGRPALEHAERLYEIALGGLARRARRNARGEDERRYLTPLERLLEHAESPADDAARGLKPGDTPPAPEILKRTALGALT